MKYLLPIAAMIAVVVAGPQFAWAAEPQEAMPLEQALEQLKTYDYGQSDKILRAIEAHVGQTAADAKPQVAAKLAAVLAQPKASQAAKVFVCQQLLVVGTEAQVPALAKLLDDPQTAEIARYTLDAIPGEASLSVLRGILVGRISNPSYGLVIGAINSLGNRRDAKSTGELIQLLAAAEPPIAAAAAEALGKIGTADAAKALAKARVPAKAAVTLDNARLQCAERLAAAGDATGAAALYEQVWGSDRPAARVAGLAGLAKVAKQKAGPLVLETLGAEHPLLQATAVRLSGELPGREITAALVQRLEKLDAAGQVLVLGVLADRADRAAAEAVARRMDDKEETVRAAAVRAMAKLGDGTLVERLAQAAAKPGGAVQQAARATLVRISATDVEPKLLALAASGEPAVRVEVIRALAARRSGAAAAVLLKVAADSDPQIRRVAYEALGLVAGAESYAAVVQLLLAAPEPADAEAAERAVLAAGGRLDAVADRTRPAIAALSTAGKAKPSLLRVLGGFGGTEAVEVIRPYVSDADPAICDAAVRALSNWPDVSASGELLKIAQAAEKTTHRLLAVRGYLRLAGLAKDEAARLKMLEQVRPIAKTVESKRMLLSGLADAADSGSLHVAASFLDDADVQGEAAAAVLRIGRGLVRIDAPAVRAAMKKVMDTVKDKTLADQAAAVDEEATRVPTPGAGQQALEYDAKRSDGYKASLAKRAPKGFHLACYLDCGPDKADGVKGGPLLRLVAGGPYYWPGSDETADARFGSVAFASDVVFEVSGMNPKKTYQVGFTWWDFDHATRAQSVWLTNGKGQQRTNLVEKTPLPSAMNKQGPDGKTLPIPAQLYADGSLRITFRNESQPNSVVCELWVWESDAAGQAAAPARLEVPGVERTVMAQVVGTPPSAKPNVLLVTGQELHDWKATAPVVVEMLQKDPRLHVRTVEDPSFLADPSIHQYDAIVLHFMNWQKPSPGPAARENFTKYVESGKGVFLIHFACGAWQDWPEFRKLVGRVWDPKLRAHDPRGPFRVTMVDTAPKPRHPIVQGLQPIDADDELYTCLGGDAPIEVLAVAKSKVDHKDYPMAFVYHCGKGRVFQCLLGHDVKAMKMPGVDELFRRGCAWSAGLTPVPAGK